jgi:hypothetical protein
VNIVDVNDEAPVFEPIYGCVTITEFHDLHDTVTTVKASDADDPNTPNGRMLFSIVGGNDLGMYISYFSCFILILRKIWFVEWNQLMR